MTRPFSNAPARCRRSPEWGEAHATGWTRIGKSRDYFCKDRSLPKLGEGDHIALLSAGAYGSVMGSNYNSRSLPTEVLVNGRKAAVVRQRQAIADIWENEKTAPWQK